ncbi:hypothetical protein FACS1894167_06040 [Synergistales bacterium]|nr:hypothetical protein FACS1894167_06040 [Synergistales bacterium]
MRKQSSHMASAVLSEIKRKLSRLFLGRIVVRELRDSAREPIKIRTYFRKPEIKQLRTRSRVGAALFMEWKNAKAKSAGPILSDSFLRNFKVRSANLTVPNTLGVKSCKLNIKARAAHKSALKRIGRAAISRRNRMNFLKTIPKFERSTLLALYSPLFRDRVEKSKLDKASGNLFFWYDNNHDRIKFGDRFHLLLLRVFDGKEPLRWVWLPAEKKL